MHQIHKLELLGFKSFCDRTQIVFQEGISAIVGPNGCGKSNVADAISWVVGEQSARSLRTDRMEGIIFNGTQARKATGLAEVVLTLSLKNHFDVHDGMDFDPEGFTVSRRLYRSGESEYYLDGRRCRLKDIQALFEGTGLGPNSYALIEQGRIGQILSSKPAERRALVEEAARITLFKSRRYSAELKLEMANQNLIRVQDIIREVVRQLNSLRRQAAKARRYSRLRDELRSAHKLKLGMEERQLRGSLERCCTLFAAAQKREQEILDDLARMDGSRSAAQVACRTCEELVNRTRDELSNLKLEAGNAQQRLENQETQRLSLWERLEDLEREQLTVEERASIVCGEQENLRNASHVLAEEIARGQEALEAERAQHDALEGAIHQTEGAIEEVRSFLLNSAGRLSDLKNLKTRCQENLQYISARKDRVEGEREGKAQERARLMAGLTGYRSEWESKSARQKELADLHADFERRAANAAERLEQVSVEMAARQEEFSLMQHRFSSLEEVERRRSNYSEGVQRFLSTQLPGEEAPAAKTLADHVETDPRYEKAVEDYLNDPLQYILVERLDDAVQSVERLKRIGGGKCTFMTLRNGHSHESASAHAHPTGEGILGRLEDLLQMNEEVRLAFGRALPELASTLMVADLGTAFRVAESYSESNFLTLAGEAYSPRGTLSAAGGRKSMAGFLALKREKREIEIKLAALRGKIQSTRDQLARLKQEQSSVGESLLSLSAESRKLEVEAVVAKHHMSHLETEIQRIDQIESVAGTEILQLLEEKAAFESRLKEAAAGIAEIEERSLSSTEELRELGLRLESLKSESSALAKKLADLTSDHAVKLERRSGLEAELRRLSAELDNVRARAEANRNEKMDLEERITDLQTAKEETRRLIHERTVSIQAAETKLAEQMQHREERRNELTTLEEELRRLQTEREEALEARGRIAIEKTRLESNLEHLERICQEEFHQTLEEIISTIDEAAWQRDYGEVSQSYNQLRERIENFGAINMRALEEYRELDERNQFLNKQRNDIQKSIDDTQKAISEINRRSVEQFQDAYTNIRKNFMEVFQILFRGGQCDLRLIDEGDVLESGIDIIAQPPGKRLQNVLLLSGGEKALTAIALLIAIFRYRPSPFCVLDEVDAPLDDANIERFAQLIVELSREIQFIIITHNKKTMEIAQTIYGITMEEPGVSKIVGVDFRRREALAG